MTKKLSNKKGFTLAELLVVVAIIAVLVAVSIPIFSAQTKKANIATNQANARAAKAAAVTSVLGGSANTTIFKYDIKTGTISTTSTDKGGATLTATTDPAEWTTTTPSGIDATVYNTWYVTLDSNNTVSGYWFVK